MSDNVFSTIDPQVRISVMAQMQSPLGWPREDVFDNLQSGGAGWLVLAGETHTIF
jgi:hypothetical protein